MFLSRPRGRVWREGNYYWRWSVDSSAGQLAAGWAATWDGACESVRVVFAELVPAAVPQTAGDVERVVFDEARARVVDRVQQRRRWRHWWLS